MEHTSNENRANNDLEWALGTSIENFSQGKARARLGEFQAQPYQDPFVVITVTGPDHIRSC